MTITKISWWHGFLRYWQPSVKGKFDFVYTKSRSILIWPCTLSKLSELGRLSLTENKEFIFTLIICQKELLADLSKYWKSYKNKRDTVTVCLSLFLIQFFLFIASIGVRNPLSFCVLSPERWQWCNTLKEWSKGNYNYNGNHHSPFWPYQNTARPSAPQLLWKSFPSHKSLSLTLLDPSYRHPRNTMYTHSKINNNKSITWTMMSHN